MKERPVIFNSEMVRAILDGRKTQTRRVMAVQPESNQFGLLRISDSTKRSDIGKYHWAESNATGTHQRSALFSCQFGQVGDRLWVRETFMDLTGTGIEATTGKFEGFAYRADTPAGSYGDEVRKEYGLKWTPSLHMPRKACRILLKITAVRVERLNDISDGDAIREGCSAADMKSGDCVANVFARLWSSIYGVDSWNANPWVWVIEFRRVEVRDASK
ncbi:morphogenetic protein [Serratia nevei]|uniref:morphogenetic protein n=1 Tax=Serratia nevei TaxID=2703794 RepID=UPI0011F09E92|nr:morphogenetic protein [Serratia nevei]